MSSICYDKHKCEDCQKHSACDDCRNRNYPEPCPCGFKDYPTWWAAEVAL